MGYYTRFTLNIHLTNEKDKFNIDINLLEEDIQETLNRISGYDIIIGDTTDDIKWYAYHENMNALSQTFPSVGFCLEGEGEQSGDVWKIYYINGNSSELIQPVWPSYDYKDFFEKNRSDSPENYKNRRVDLLKDKLKEVDFSIIEYEKKIEHNINDLTVKKDIEMSKKIEIEEEIKKLLTS